jgi:hypothetical protein
MFNNCGSMFDLMPVMHAACCNPYAPGYSPQARWPPELCTAQPASAQSVMQLRSSKPRWTASSRQAGSPARRVDAAHRARAQVPAVPGAQLVVQLPLLPLMPTCTMAVHPLVLTKQHRQHIAAQRPQQCSTGSTAGPAAAHEASQPPPRKDPSADPPRCNLRL